MWKGIAILKVGFLGWLTTKLKSWNSTQWTVQFTQNRLQLQKEIKDQKPVSKSIGGAENTGRLVGSSVGASVAPSVANIPIIGWVAAGWVTMFSGNQGAEIGGGMAEDLNKNC